MTEVIESSDKILKIIFRKGWLHKIAHTILAILFFGFAAVILIRGAEPTQDAKYSVFAPIALIFIEFVLLGTGWFFFSSVLDRIDYFFDKTADKFYLKGRRNLFRKWIIEGAVSDITGVSYEIYGQDENTSSEIFLKYRLYASVTETIKCGTGDDIEDGIITENIKNFIEPEKIRS